MHSHFGKNITISIAGESHGAGLGVMIHGIPAGFRPDMEALLRFMKRRAPGQNRFSTPRKETDMPEFLSGILDGVTTGAPILAIIKNENTKSEDYDALSDIPRPGHGDFTVHEKYGGFADRRGGGHLSGRLTAPLCIAGGLAKQMLSELGIDIFAHIHAIHGVEGALPRFTEDEIPALREIAQKPFPVWDDEAGASMQAEIDTARKAGDSVGGVAFVSAFGLPAGLGAPMFDRIECRLSKAVFGIPAVRGIAFGNGFLSASLLGSENNDAFYYDADGKVKTRTNNAGGMLAGMSTGMPLWYQVAIKPTPSIGKAQESIHLSKKEETTISVGGRHDPCIVPRVLPVLESVTALSLLDLLLENSMIWEEVKKWKKH